MPGASRPLTAPILGGVLELPRAMIDQILAHARRDHPDEACGIIAGRDGAATRVVEMANAERSPTFYRFEATEQLRVWRAMDDNDEVPFVIYHSHTATEAHPSRTDISLASEADAHYLLVSTRSAAEEVRSFRIVEGAVTEEEITIT